MYTATRRDLIGIIGTYDACAECDRPAEVVTRDRQGFRYCRDCTATIQNYGIYADPIDRAAIADAQAYHAMRRKVRDHLTRREVGKRRPTFGSMSAHLDILDIKAERRAAR